MSTFPAHEWVNTVLPASDGIPMGLLPAWHAARTPRRAAITEGDLTVDWTGLEARANRRARALQALGVGQDDFVTIALPNSVAFYETAFAVWKLGAVPNVVSPKLPAAELDAILELVRPRVLVCLRAAARPGVPVHAVDEPLDASLSAEPLPERVSTYWKALASGGSTGRPKIIVDHMPSRWDPAAGALGQQAGWTVLSPGPLYHNAPFSFMHCALFAGCHVIEMGRFDALRALELIEKHRVQWVNFVPTMMHRIWRLPDEQRNAFDLSSLEIVFHMASACPVWLKERWIEWLGPERIWELYGGTERQGRTVLSGVEWLQHKGSVGRVSPGARLVVLDEQGRECPPGEIGEIYFLPDTGRNSTYHYLGAEARAHGEWESLGDLGHLDADGYLYLSDRRTDLVISGGANIYPAEVEAAIDAHPQVQTSAVIGLPDDDLGQRVHAIVQPAADALGTDEDALRASILDFLATRLVRYKIPRSIEFSSEPMRDDAGKMRRAALRAARLPRTET